MTMEQTINRNLLRYAVQQAMFCPRCQRVLDMTRAVNVDITSGTETASKTLCTGCYDAAAPRLQAIATEKNLRLDVLDGRVLFGRKGVARD